MQCVVIIAIITTAVNVVYLVVAVNDVIECKDNCDLINAYNLTVKTILALFVYCTHTSVCTVGYLLFKQQNNFHIHNTTTIYLTVQLIVYTYTWLHRPGVA